MQINTLINQHKKKFDKFYINILNKKLDNSLLSKAMKYSSVNGGKRIRAFLVSQSSKIVKLSQKNAMILSSSIESIHSYSLIHDDLPCMDNDTVRRGKPAAHIKFGEAPAVLAGSSLLTLAFEIISDKKYSLNFKCKNEIVRSLAICSGHTGIAGGQDLDLKFENKKKRYSQIIEMQKKKTGKLFNFCCYAPALIAKKNLQEQNKMSKLGEDIGLLFQLADDFLDVKGSKEKTGKSIKKDKKKGKSTLIKILGIEKSNKYAENLKINILRKLKKHGKKAEDLNNIVKFILERKF